MDFDAICRRREGGGRVNGAEKNADCDPIRRASKGYPEINTSRTRAVA
jgi:hypothetical protein